MSYSPEKASTIARRNLATGNSAYQEEYVPHKILKPRTPDDYVKRSHIDVVGNAPSSFTSTNKVQYAKPPKDSAEWSSPSRYERTRTVQPQSPRYQPPNQI